MLIPGPCWSLGAAAPSPELQMIMVDAALLNTHRTIATHEKESLLRANSTQVYT